VSDDSPKDNIIKLATLRDAGKLLPSNDEEAIALAFADRHVDDLRYVPAWHRWYRYNGGHWVHDETAQAVDDLRALCREMATHGEKSASSVAVVASARTVFAVERLARVDQRLATAVSRWDANDWLFNAGGDETATGTTFDLRTGVARDPDPRDYITKATLCCCAPLGTPHPRWTEFLRRVTGEDLTLIAFLQRWCGYCCTGSTQEHKLVFLHGSGANGKGTFVNTIRDVLHDYGCVANMTTFLVNKTDNHPTELARLAGTRLVVAQEIPKGRRWDETKIKALTGGDKISARFMRQDFFEYWPHFKLMICGNNKPRLSSVGEAMRRRLLLVPFTVQIPEAERDQELPTKLRQEWPAILRWMLDGCQEWQRIGLAPPPTVLKATESYFQEENTLQQWLDEKTYDGSAAAFTRTADLFASWKEWCVERNFRPDNLKNFSGSLVDMGFEKGRNSSGQQGFFRLCVGSKPNSTGAS
jgi:putative DNA primase/helicase